MPELPEVETIVADLRPHLVGRTIVRCELRFPSIVRHPEPEVFIDSITGLTGFDDIALAVRMLLESSIPRCSVSVRQGQHEGVPVLFGGAVIATISMSRPHELLTDDETRLVTAVAERISGRLNNAIVLEAARREATLDELTGIANRRAFERMSDSMGGQNFSIVLVDVNAFKAVNDNFGHQAGDAALVRIAKHLQAAFTHAELICERMYAVKARAKRWVETPAPAV